MAELRRKADPEGISEPRLKQSSRSGDQCLNLTGGDRQRFDPRLERQSVRPIQRGGARILHEATDLRAELSDQVYFVVIHAGTKPLLRSQVHNQQLAGRYSPPLNIPLDCFWNQSIGARATRS